MNFCISFYCDLGVEPKSSVIPGCIFLSSILLYLVIAFHVHVCINAERGRKVLVFYC